MEYLTEEKNETEMETEMEMEMERLLSGDEWRLDWVEGFRVGYVERDDVSHVCHVFPA
jgi:hypothetical protein